MQLAVLRGDEALCDFAGDYRGMCLLYTVIEGDDASKCEIFRWDWETYFENPHLFTNEEKADKLEDKFRLYHICYAEMGKKLLDISFCKKSEFYLGSGCFVNVAIKLKDPSICQYAEGINSESCKSEYDEYWDYIGNKLIEGSKNKL